MVCQGSACEKPAIKENVQGDWAEQVVVALTKIAEQQRGEKHPERQQVGALCGYVRQSEHAAGEQVGDTESPPALGPVPSNERLEHAAKNILLHQWINQHPQEQCRNRGTQWAAKQAQGESEQGASGGGCLPLAVVPNVIGRVQSGALKAPAGQ